MATRHADRISFFGEAYNTVVLVGHRLLRLRLRQACLFMIYSVLPSRVCLGTVVFLSVRVFRAQPRISRRTYVGVLGEHVPVNFARLEPESVFEGEVKRPPLEPQPIVVLFVVLVRILLGDYFFRPAFQDHAPAFVLLVVSVSRYGLVVLLVFFVVFEDFLFERPSKEVCAQSDLGHCERTRKIGTWKGLSRMTFLKLSNLLRFVKFISTVSRSCASARSCTKLLESTQHTLA